MSQNVLYKIANPYAEALLELSQLNNVLEQTSQDLSFISQMITDSPELKSFLLNPLINNHLKKNVLNQAFSQQVSDFILKFLFVLLDRRRISLLHLVIEKYFSLVYQAEATIVTEISTVNNLTEEQQQNLIEKIKMMTNGKQVKLITNIDPSLIGGFILKIGSKVIDASILGKLQQIKFYLEAN
uniref:ATP synthase subunit delta n=1 Tax=Campylaephora sungminbooi TaxID=1896769 RepID=A0A1B0RRR6_9FLOR|nr:ATP synthase subunit delta [Campylaephora sungminbooi]AKU47467.1 ATP synthase subunit delta [Campylaephora sungminbooi]ALN11914.1 ATP synthase subunit delta [Campylaephora sungminbooi]